MHGARARVGVSARVIQSITRISGKDNEDYIGMFGPLRLALNNGVTYGATVIRVRTW